MPLDKWHVTCDVTKYPEQHREEKKMSLWTLRQCLPGSEELKAATVVWFFRRVTNAGGQDQTSSPTLPLLAATRQKPNTQPTKIWLALPASSPPHVTPLPPPHQTHADTRTHAPSFIPKFERMTKTRARSYL